MKTLVVVAGATYFVVIVALLRDALIVRREHKQHLRELDELDRGFDRLLAMDEIDVEMAAMLKELERAE